MRITVKGPDDRLRDLMNRFGYRRKAPGMFSVDLPEGALATLDNLAGVATRPVTMRYLPVMTGESRPVPAAQVPYGIQVMYNGSLQGGKPCGGRGIRVAIIDSGLLIAHRDFAGKEIFACWDYTGESTVPVAGCTDEHGHGTHVAGTIGANGGADGLGLYGMAPEVALGIYKVCGLVGGCGDDDIAAAVDQAIADGAQIISISLGGNGADDWTRGAVQRAASAGVLVIAAAGNDGPANGSIDYPGAYSEVVAVASLYQDVEGTDYAVTNLIVNSWSSRGIADVDLARGMPEGAVEVSAPGYEIESTWKDEGYYTAMGTSMAVPHITGLAAKMWQGCAESTRHWLQGQARKFDVTRSNERGGVVRTDRVGYDNAAGWGNPRATN